MRDIGAAFRQFGAQARDLRIAFVFDIESRYASAHNAPQQLLIRVELARRAGDERTPRHQRSARENIKVQPNAQRAGSGAQQARCRAPR